MGRVVARGKREEGGGRMRGRGASVVEEEEGGGVEVEEAEEVATAMPGRAPPKCAASWGCAASASAGSAEGAAAGSMPSRGSRDVGRWEEKGVPGEEGTASEKLLPL